MSFAAATPGVVVRRAPAEWPRRVWSLLVAGLVAWAVWRAGVNPGELVNSRGITQVREFVAASIRPDLSGDFVRLTVRESFVTLAYAVLGTFVALCIGVVNGIYMSERLWTPLAGPMRRGRLGWGVGRLANALPRSMHEVVFGLVLVNILGLNPLVAVLAIGIPFGAVTAKVFSEMLDEAPRDAELAMRAAGAGRLTALFFGTVPSALTDLLSYAFYRFECSIRSAAVLGIVGAGGLGFQLQLSFSSLKYDQMWTLLWALVLLSASADWWSASVRRRRNSAAVEMHLVGVGGSSRRAGTPRRDRFLVASAAVLVAGVPLAFWWLDIHLSTLWNARARTLGNELVADAFPPEIGRGGVRELVSDAVDTVALAVLAIALAWSIASALAFLARRTPSERVVDSGLAGPARWLVGVMIRFGMLVARSVPPPVWAFVVVFVLFPGLWPGAVALGIYNAGILGRLQAEVIENIDPAPGDSLRASGASEVGVMALATVPAVTTRFVALGLYRWEVAIRETVIVGVVGAAGLGRRLDEQTSSFNYDGILATILALLAVTIAVDLASASIRRSLR